jgi:ketosteroid isomerase-like protein
VKALLALVVLAGSAYAGPSADVGRAFQAFVETGGTSDPAALELFIPPQGDSPDDQFEWPVLPKDRGEARGYLDHPKVVVKKLAVAASGKSAWLAAEIKNAKTPLRASAFLVKDDKGWHVTAAHWSRAQTPAKPKACKALAFEWRPKASVPAAAREPVLAVMKTLGHDFPSVVAPGVVFGIGTAAPDFAHWKVTGPWHEDGKDLSARANIAPDGQLAWMALEIGGPTEQCTDYRAFFVLEKQKAGWRVVHQHYSLPAKTP